MSLKNEFKAFIMYLQGMTQNCKSLLHNMR